MPFFAVLGFDHPPHMMGERDANRAAHRAYVKGNDQMIRLAGAMTDGKGNQSGSLYVFEADNAEQVRAWTSKEPFCNGGVYKDLHIVELVLGYSKLPQMNWPG